MGKVIVSRSRWYEYLFVIFIILWSGGGFTYGLFPQWMFLALPVLSIIVLKRGQGFNINEIYTILILAFILFLQKLKYGGSIVTLFTPIAVVLSCAMFAKVLKNSFNEIFVTIIYYLACITLTLWCISQVPFGLNFLRAIATSLPQLGWENIIDNTNVVDSMYIYSIPREIDGFFSNSGPFWEPGRFTIYLTLALSINIFYNEQPLFSKQNIILIITNITTFSTTGYVAMGLLLCGYVLLSNIKIQHKILMLMIMAIIIPYVSQLDFMSAKILEQSQDIDSAWSRFGAMVYHWGQILESPIIGYGPFLMLAEDDLMVSPNGLTDLIRYYGIPFSIFLYVLLFKSTQLYVGIRDKKKNILVFIVILVLCFSQTIMVSPFFYLLYFFALNNSHK